MTGHDTGYANPNSAAAASTTTGTLFTRAKLYELVNSVVYGERLDPPVEYVCIQPLCIRTDRTFPFIRFSPSLHRPFLRPYSR